MTSKKITKKSAGTVQLALDVAPESKQLLESLRKKFELKTKAQTFEIIIRQIAALEKLSEFRKCSAVDEILFEISSKLDQLLERFEEVS